MDENRQMKLSLITVTYNCENTLEDTFRSVKEQKCEELEYIVIDGGSTDRTVEIIEKYDDIITFWSSSPDEGIYDAMNRGLKKATGDYIGFLHADDIFFSSDTLLNLMSEFREHKPDVLYGDLVYVNSTDTDKVIRRWESCEFTPGLLGKGWMPPHPTLYIKRDVIQDTGFFDTSYRIASDYDYILRLFTQQSLKFLYLPVVIVKMRMGGASNKSVSNIILKSKEDIRALKKNGVGGLITLIRKNVSKIPQFFK